MNDISSLLLFKQSTIYRINPFGGLPWCKNLAKTYTPGQCSSDKNGWYIFVLYFLCFYQFHFCDDHWHQPASLQRPLSRSCSPYTRSLLQLPGDYFHCSLLSKSSWWFTTVEAYCAWYMAEVYVIFDCWKWNKIVSRSFGAYPPSQDILRKLVV